MADDSSKRNVHIGWKDKLKVLLFAPNLVDYIRIVLFLPLVSGLITERQPWTFGFLYVLGFILDGIDGLLARLLNQSSAFGAFLDTLLDCLVRLFMWGAAARVAAAAVNSDGGGVGWLWADMASKFTLLLATLIPSIEFSVFLVTHKQGGAAWKTGGSFACAPPWVTRVMANGFRNPWGVWVMFGLHFSPLWTWTMSILPPLLFSPFLLLGLLLSSGRLYCLAIELWVLSRYFDFLLTEDAGDLMKKKS